MRFLRILQEKENSTHPNSVRSDKAVHVEYLVVADSAHQIHSEYPVSGLRLIGARSGAVKGRQSAAVRGLLAAAALAEIRAPD